MKNNIVTEKGRLVCTKFKSCGGCAFEQEYAEQTIRKKASVSNKLRFFGGVSRLETMADPYRYRCKVTRVYKKASNGQLISSVFKSKSGGCVPVADCMLEDKRLCEIAYDLGGVFSRFEVRPYDFETGKGCLRHIMLRKGYETGQILLCIVTQPGTLKKPVSLANEIARRFPDITTIVHNECASSMPLTLGKHEQVLTGDGCIEDRLLGLSFRISAGSFMQVNPQMTAALYAYAREQLDDNTGTLLDAYCGTGTVGLICAGKAQQVIGVEKTPSAIEDAKRNAKANGIENARFVCADATQFIEELAARGEHIDAVILDPPRAGASSRFIEAVGTLAPKQVIYISCSPDTLARDLRLFKKQGYRIGKPKCFDMFPHTRHIETVAVLKRSTAAQ